MTFDNYKLNIPEHLMLAVNASILASMEICEVYQKTINPRIKHDGSPVTEADDRSSDIIERELLKTGIPIISEESEKEIYSIRQNWTQSWCVDPLDGTKEFIKRNDEFCVCIALIEHQEPTFGIIAAPIAQEVIFGGIDTGVFRCSFTEFAENKFSKIEPISQKSNEIIMASSWTPHEGKFKAFLEDLEEKYAAVYEIRKGSALKFMDLATGKADIYPRFAPTMEWDVAAGQAILEGIGGSIVHAETGKPLKYNKADLYNPHFVARRVAK